jgi:hypothetical protein
VFFFSDSQSLIDQAHDQITRLLTTEWLVSDVENPGGSFVPLGVTLDYTLTTILDELDERRKDLIRIRQIYIPELIIRLHFLLFDSRHFIPEYVYFPFFLHLPSLFSSLLITLSAQKPQTRFTAREHRGRLAIPTVRGLCERGWEEVGRLPWSREGSDSWWIGGWRIGSFQSDGVCLSRYYLTFLLLSVSLTNDNSPLSPSRRGFTYIK